MRQCRQLLWFLVAIRFLALAGKKGGKMKANRQKNVQQTTTWVPDTNILQKPAEEIEHDLKYWKVIPDLLDEAPKLSIWVEWADGPEVLFGNEINQTLIDKEPFWFRWETDSAYFDTYYTMILTGIDEQTEKHTLHREKQLWVVVNRLEYEFLSGEYLTEYLGPKPANGPEAHRYVFLVYKQPGKIHFNEPKIAVSQDNLQRTNFSSKLFAEKYNLGKPIAVNFFRVKRISS